MILWKYLSISQKEIANNDSRKSVTKLFEKTARFLVCSKGTKRRLLDGFYEEITDAGDPFTSEQEIIETYGTPEEFAKSLQIGVAEEERQRYQQYQKRQLRRGAVFGICIAMLCIILSVIVVSFCNNYEPAYYTDKITEDAIGTIIWETETTNGVDQCE